MVICTTLSIIIGYIMDLLFGDPHNIPHPVSAIGKLISICTDKFLKLNDTSEHKKRNGKIMVFIVEFFCAFVPFGILYVLYSFNLAVGLIAEGIMCYQILAAKSLKDESNKVADAIKDGDIERARYNVSMIVGRDTKKLDEAGIIRAAVETVAENTSDGVIAPLFYMSFGGAVLGFMYKGVNTMDSMVGYKNEKYLDYGRAAALLDDIVNFIPARISAVLMIISAGLLGYNMPNAYKIFKRDRYKSASPNSGQTEAACSGALDIRLLGDAYYFGKLVKKPYIGDANRDIEYKDIYRANRLMYMSTFLMMAVILIIRVAIIGIIK